MSIAGGYYKAVEAAAEHGMEVVQLFTKNNNQWRAKPIVEDDVRRFRGALGDRKIAHPLSHSSYLINLAAPDRALWEKSLEAFVVELRRADALGIKYVVLHPGAFTSSGEEAGIQAVIKALDEIHDQTRELASQCLLETTAGQGSCLGCRFEQLAAILDGVQSPDRLGVCVDTCHIFAAGYPLGTPKEYKATFREFDETIGTKRIKAFHVNDSKRELGSRVDRHEHIGRGRLGLEPFRHLLNDPRFQEVPMYLETPKGDHEGRTWDAVNLETLRSLVEC
jgi:deoxyribonuclease-4